MPDSRLRFERPESVVSEAIESSKRPIHLRHMMPTMSFGTCSDGKTTQSIDEEEHLALDRIMYNAYGDIASLVRKVQLEHEMNKGRIGDKESDAILRNAQNVAIREFLNNFITQQPDTLVGALSMLKLSSETDNQSIPVEQNNETSAQSPSPSTLSRISETRHQMSSHISNQNRHIVDRHLSQPASSTIMANNMAERGCSMPNIDMQTPIRQPNSNSGIIEGTVKANTNYDDWADDDFEDSLALIPDISPKYHSRQVQRNEGILGSHSSSGLSFNHLNESIADDFRDAFNSNATRMPDIGAESQAHSNFTQRDVGCSGTFEQLSPFIFTQSERSINDESRASPSSTFDLGEFESFASFERDFGEMFEGNTFIDNQKPLLLAFY